MKEVKIGHIYRNKWGDDRTVIYVEERDVHYIEKRNDQKLWSYNPYVNHITVDQFLLKFQNQEITNPLTEKENKQIKKWMELADEEWHKLMVTTAVNINKTLFNKI